MHHLIRSVFMILLVLPTLTLAQGWYNHPELDWQTLETEHFIIHFHQGTERSAREAGIVAEKAYGPITTIYQYEPDSKTHLIIQDTDDYSNGAAYYYDNKIVIWALPLDFDLRGSHRWMQNVISHEFTHIVQIESAMKFPRHIPGIYFQYMGYEKEKRDDVLYGFPNRIISYPLPGTAIPPWLAEGTAQHMYKEAKFDFWDSHRDMILRDKSMHNEVFSLADMNTFGKKGFGNECTYDHGFAFVEYLVNRFGEDVLHRISQSLKKPYNYSIRKALKDATGRDGLLLHSDWEEQMYQNYSQELATVSGHEVKGFILESEGTTNVHPVWAPDAKRFAFLSNRDNDYFGQTDLFIYNISDSSSTKIMGGIQTAVTWLNDSTLVYTKRGKPNKNGSRFYDLYQYSIPDEKEKRLTHDLRLTSPVYNAEINQIAAITTYDGTSNVMVSDADSIDFKLLTHETNGLQMFSLSWSGTRLLVDAVYDQGRSLYEIDRSGELNRLSEEEWDTRDPLENKGFSLAARDKSGIFNLYGSTPEGEGYITNVVGGAFMPDISSDGKIIYSLYENSRYNIAILDTMIFIPEEEVGYDPDYYLTNPNSELIDQGISTEAVPYSDTMSKPFILPRLMVDYNTLKPGFYAYANDVLDKLSIFGGGSLNNIGDKDIFLLFEFRKYKPTLFTNIYWISRNIHQKLTYLINYLVESDLTIQFFSADIGTRFPLGLNKFWLQYTYTKYRETINQVVREADHTLIGQGGISFDYYRGHQVSLRWNLKMRKPEFAGNMLPSNGFQVDTFMSYEWNGFMDGFGFNEEYSTYQPVFKPNNTMRITIQAEKNWTLNHEHKIVSSLATRIEVISNHDVNDFFQFYGGGMIGMKGYTFYDSTLAGTSLFINTAVIRMPLFMEKSLPVAHMNFQNLTVGWITQVGGGFYGRLQDWVKNQNYKISTGVELRLSGYSFFAYPTAISYEYHVPIGDTDKRGKHYFKLLFDF